MNVYTENSIIKQNVTRQVIDIIKKLNNVTNIKYNIYDTIFMGNIHFTLNDANKYSVAIIDDCYEIAEITNGVKVLKGNLDIDELKDELKKVK